MKKTSNRPSPNATSWLGNLKRASHTAADYGGVKSAIGTKLAHEFERRTAGFAVFKAELIRQKMAVSCLLSK
jgi:hypothetical protein